VFVAVCRCVGLLGLTCLVLGSTYAWGDTSGVSFQLDVQPILTARGCNSGPCHGKARGQNGFQLSLLGFDSDFDYQAIAMEGRGRRVFPAAPDQSLLLQKATASLPHGGGRRFEANSRAYETLRRWIGEGMPRRQPDEPALSHIAIAPQETTMRPPEHQAATVTAHYSDGTTRDVTGLTAYQSNEPAHATVDEEGLFTAGSIAGEAVIMARYMNLIATCRVTVPLAGEVPDSLYGELPRQNFIDGLVWDKLKSLRITPSDPAGDAKFLRRAHLDIMGRLPTPDATRAFLADDHPEKRSRLVDRLLERPEYADHWASKWVDLLRPNPYRVGIKAVLNYDQWIRDSFRQNKPYDQFVRELITAQGSTWKNGAVTLFRDRRTPDEITTLVSQLFLGIRLECCKCHHHPFEKWGQDDFYSFAAYFARVGHKGTGLSPPISGGEEMVLVRSSGTVTHPLTGQPVAARPLFGDTPTVAADVDPRRRLAQWITSDENEFFAMTMANRVWADMMGRGLVEPVDDLRATNPPTNAPLLEALGAEFRRQQYDQKQLIRTIATSYVYGLSSIPNPRNVGDTSNYSRHYRKRMRAESLLDAVADITGIPHRFPAMPAGSRATEIWTHRVQSLFLDTFGRPDPNKDPPCERTRETTVTQALHLMNSPDIHARVTSDAGRAAQLASSERTPEEIVDEVYLLVYCRHPRPEEREVALSLFRAPEANRRRATEDLMWALMNTPEFVFID
jgi:hypothetical protein